MSEKELRAEFERMKAQSQYANVSGRYIRIYNSVPDETDKLMAELRSGKSFDDIAGRYPKLTSTSREAVVVGEFDSGKDIYSIPKPVRRVAWTMKVGETSEWPLKDDATFIVHVDKRTEHKSLDERDYVRKRDEIAERLSGHHVSIVDFVARPDVKIRAKLLDHDAVEINFILGDPSAIRNLPRPIFVDIPVGTYLKSVAPGLDALVAESRTLKIERTGIHDIYPYSVRIFRPNDGSKSELNIVAVPENPDLQSLVVAFNQAPFSQYGFFAAGRIVQNYSHWEIWKLQWYGANRQPLGTVVDGDQIVGALRSLDKGGYDTTDKKVWYGAYDFMGDVWIKDNRQWLSTKLQDIAKKRNDRVSRQMETYKVGTTTIGEFATLDWKLNDSFRGWLSVLSYRFDGVNDMNFVVGTCAQPEIPLAPRYTERNEDSLMFALRAASEGSNVGRTALGWAQDPTSLASVAASTSKCMGKWYLKFENRVLVQLTPVS